MQNINLHPNGMYLPPVEKLGGLAAGTTMDAFEMDPRVTMQHYGATKKKYGCQACQNAIADPVGFVKVNWLPIAVVVALAGVVFLYMKKK